MSKSSKPPARRSNQSAQSAGQNVTCSAQPGEVTVTSELSEIDTNLGYLENGVSKLRDLLFAEGENQPASPTASGVAPRVSNINGRVAWLVGEILSISQRLG